MTSPNPNLVGILPSLQEGVSLADWMLLPENGAGRARSRAVASGIEIAGGIRLSGGSGIRFPYGYTCMGSLCKQEEANGYERPILL